MKSAFAALVFALGCPGVLWADSVGKVTADVDGKAREWHVIAAQRDGKTIMSASLHETKRLADITVQGHPEDRFTVTDVLSINASWFGKFDPAKAPVTIEVIFMPEGMSKPFYTSDQVPEQPTLTIDALTHDGEAGQLTGSFTAKVCLVPRLYEAPDMNDCKTLAGTIETALQVR